MSKCPLIGIINDNLTKNKKMLILLTTYLMFFDSSILLMVVFVSAVIPFTALFFCLHTKVNGKWVACADLASFSLYIGRVFSTIPPLFSSRFNLWD